MLGFLWLILGSKQCFIWRTIWNTNRSCFAIMFMLLYSKEPKNCQNKTFLKKYIILKHAYLQVYVCHKGQMKIICFCLRLRFKKKRFKKIENSHTIHTFYTHKPEFFPSFSARLKWYLFLFRPQWHLMRAEIFYENPSERI